MNISVEYSFKTNAYRYFYTLFQTLTHKYEKPGFYLIKNKEKVCKNFNCILLPQLLSQPNASEFDYQKKVGLDIFSSYENLENFEKVENELKVKFPLSKKALDKTTRYVAEVLSSKYEHLKKLIPGIAQFEDYPIHVLLTDLGTNYSFMRIRKKIYLFIRTDQHPGAILEALLSLYILDVYKLSANDEDNEYMKNLQWYVNEGIVDFIAQYTCLSPIFTEYVQTNHTTKLYDKRLLKESNDYKKEMGLTLQKNLIIKSEQIYSEKAKKNLKGLTPNETKLLMALVKSDSSVCLYEDMAKEIWGDAYLEKFSLYYLNKAIHQLKYKLRLNNLRDVSIENVKGRGYILVQ